MKISIVIPNWNGADRLTKNLPQVLKTDDVNEVIVVDDYSTDNSLEVLKRDFPEVKVIKKDKNSGFSTAVNLGVKNANGDLVFILNSDAVPEKDCLKFVIPNFKDPKVFSVGCNVGGTWAWIKFKNGYFWHYQGEKSESTHQTLWSSGGSGVFRKDLWEELGGLDELFNPFYEEDTDLGYRATKRGYLNLWEPKAKVEHYKTPGVISTNFSKKTISNTAQRNQLYFTWKNLHDRKLMKEHIRYLINMLFTHPKYWLVFLAAFKNLSVVLRKRKIEKVNLKVSDREILNKVWG